MEYECSRIGSGMLGGAWVAGAGPLSRSFDLRKIVIDSLSYHLLADHKGAAQD